MIATPDNARRIDKEAVLAKYVAERDKRLRADGNAQYIRLTGRFADYNADPYTAPIERAPVFDHVPFTFVGGGFAGLLTGARLAEAGVPGARIVEKGGDFGGTWYWNRYPGAQCDTASMVYMPLLEETGHRPTEKYAHGPEIHEGPRFTQFMIRHRKAREASILHRLAKGEADIPSIVRASYIGIDPRLVNAAGYSVLAHLEDMVERGIVATDGAPTIDKTYRLLVPLG